MGSFIIPQFKAEILSAFQIISHLSEASPVHRQINSNLELYSPEDTDNSEDKIINLMDGDEREGFLNVYFLHFSNDVGEIFIFGSLLNVKISKTYFIGKMGNDYYNKRNLLMDLMILSANDFKYSYEKKDISSIKKLIEFLITNLRA